MANNNAELSQERRRLSLQVRILEKNKKQTMSRTLIEKITKLQPFTPDEFNKTFEEYSKANPEKAKNLEDALFEPFANVLNNWDYIQKYIFQVDLWNNPVKFRDLQQVANDLYKELEIQKRQELKKCFTVECGEAMFQLEPVKSEKPLRQAFIEKFWEVVEDFFELDRQPPEGTTEKDWLQQIDNSVAPGLLQAAAHLNFEDFGRDLKNVLPEGTEYEHLNTDSPIQIRYRRDKCVKAGPRMVAKIIGYREEEKDEKEWMHGSKICDVLRCSVICETPKHLLAVWKSLTKTKQMKIVRMKKGRWKKIFM